MRILVVSDLHLELGESYTAPVSTDYDVVVLAGDIQCPGSRGVLWARRETTYFGKPVVMVPGNHEYYGREMVGELQAMRDAAQDSNVHVLDRNSVVIDGVRFLGCTLWTDFQLPVLQSDGAVDTDVMQSLAQANRRMNDFRRIEVLSPTFREHDHRRFRRPLHAGESLALHWIDRDWLRREFAKTHDGPTVVVTHHAPSSGSVTNRYHGDSLTPAFVSNLPDGFFEVSSLWIHGHTHTPTDHFRGRCRVVSNPRGYRMRDSSFENSAFNASMIVDVVAGRA